MKNQYFLKDKKAQIYKAVNQGKDTEGFDRGNKYYPIAENEIWCYSAQLSQKAIALSHTLDQIETRFFVFNHYSGIAVYDMILYRGEWYRITRVDTKDDYNGEVFVYVQNAISGWIPNDEQIEPYTAGIWD
ncbi:MAG: hypothetical protein K6E33_09905 [Lachnospiraceae bacterium]|nr:hypothetical protein [Lachnospiraceae bacterium]